MTTEIELLASIARKIILQVDYIDDSIDSNLVIDGWVENLTPDEMAIVKKLADERTV